MPYKMNFFKKIAVLVFALMIPVALLYGYSYQISVNVVKNELQESGLRQLTFFLSQVETNATQLASHSVTLSNERNVRDFTQLPNYTSFVDMLLTKKQIEDKLYLYSTSSPWINSFSIHAPLTDDVLSTYPVIQHSLPELDASWITSWTYQEAGDYEPERFTWYTIDPPIHRSEPETANLIIEVSFTTDNLRAMLDQFMTSRQGNPFFYTPGKEPITNRQGDHEAILELTALLDKHELGSEPAHQRFTIRGESYLVSYLPSDVLGWHLVDFVPLDSILQPMEQNRNFFYMATAILLVTGIAVSFAIYRKVQLPIRDLMVGVQKLKRGDYSARLHKKPKSEFLYLFNRFNEMAEQIQELIEKVYAEKLRSQEATVKQLQSQINPHFFYNCLFFIVSMSRLGENKAVEAMATSLGDYYRYATRSENQQSTIGEELDMVCNYLTIQKLRQQVDFEVNIPDSMLDIPLPRLMLQPLVENAIVHGLEPMESLGKIYIYGEQRDNEIMLAVEDNGVGLSEREFQQLQRKIDGPLTEEMGCGLWNVNQRLLHIYGQEAGLTLTPSPSGGVKAVLLWRKEE